MKFGGRWRDKNFDCESLLDRPSGRVIPSVSGRVNLSILRQGTSRPLAIGQLGQGQLGAVPCGSTPRGKVSAEAVGLLSAICAVPRAFKAKATAGSIPTACGWEPAGLPAIGKLGRRQLGVIPRRSSPLAIGQLGRGGKCRMGPWAPFRPSAMGNVPLSPKDLMPQW
jgi:hypothetical protein